MSGSYPARGRKTKASSGANTVAYSRPRFRCLSAPSFCRPGMLADVEVIDNAAGSRFELHQDGQMAELVYRLRGKRLVLVHTEVPADLEGHGIGGRLVTAAIDRAARKGLILVPLCPFALGWLERHPETAGQAVIDWDG